MITSKILPSHQYRMGKLCRRCLGPMEEFAPGDLLSQAALQMSENLMAEVRTTVKSLTVRGNSALCVGIRTFGSQSLCSVYLAACMGYSMEYMD